MLTLMKTGETISNTSGVTVSLEIYKKFFGAWIYVPCVDGVGSCTINDLCDRIHPGDSCPLAPWYTAHSATSVRVCMY